MTFDQALKKLSEENPDILYLNGKTSTGKSTFAQMLQQARDYRIIKLDEIVIEEVIRPLRLPGEGEAFEEIYKKRDRTDWIELFITAVEQEVAHTLQHGHKVILDGAVAHPLTLRDMLKSLPSVTFLYFHPANLAHYERNLTERFLTTSKTYNGGLPLRFWRLVDADSFAAFCETRIITDDITQAIKAYATSSQEESIRRLADLRHYFNDIQIVET